VLIFQLKKQFYLGLQYFFEQQFVDNEIKIQYPQIPSNPVGSGTLAIAPNSIQPSVNDEALMTILNLGVTDNIDLISEALQKNNNILDQSVSYILDKNRPKSVTKK
jgi:hypothetical protein